MFTHMLLLEYNLMHVICVYENNVFL